MSAISWQAQPGPQTHLLSCPCFEIFFGGARGGGKTFGMLLDWCKHQEQYGANASGLMVRRTYKQLDDTIKNGKRVFGSIGATWRDSEQKFAFPNGSEIKFRHLESDADAEDYQGHEYTRLYVEEIGNFPNPDPINRLMATLRSSHGVPVGFRATGNPGGPGHQWVKARYIDPDPIGLRVIKTEYKDPITGVKATRDRVFIPAKLHDNKYLNPAEYQAQLQMVGDAALVKAWLEGDWNIVIGAFFDNFSVWRHVIRPITIPDYWLRFRAGDWGSAKPFAFGWFAVAADDVWVDPELDPDKRFVIPRGALVMYRELYGVRMKPNGEFVANQGVKWTAEEAALAIVQAEKDDVHPLSKRTLIKYGDLDPAAFAMTSGPCVAERMARFGVLWSPAKNQRTNRDGRMGGWDMLRHRLNGEAGRPMIFFFNSCTHTIRTIPAMQHDPAHVEDVDTDAEDHCADMVRYACMSRPWIPSGYHEPGSSVPFWAQQPLIATSEGALYPAPPDPVRGPVVSLDHMFREQEKGERRRLSLVGHGRSRI